MRIVFFGRNGGMVDTGDLKSPALIRRAGSSPAFGILGEVSECFGNALE